MYSEHVTHTHIKEKKKLVMGCVLINCRSNLRKLMQELHFSCKKNTYLISKDGMFGSNFTRCSADLNRGSSACSLTVTLKTYVTFSRNLFTSSVTIPRLPSTGRSTNTVELQSSSGTAWTELFSNLHIQPKVNFEL